MVPTGISESVLDHDYTLLAVQRYVEGSRGFWLNIIAGARNIEKTSLEPLMAFQRAELKAFKVRACRRDATWGCRNELT